MAMPVDEYAVLDQFSQVELDSESEDILIECYKSTKTFAKVFMPETFDAEFSDLHDQIFDLIDHSGAQKIVISAPRGIGKTTISRTYAMKELLYAERHFIPYVSKSETAAMMQTENIKAELMSNELLQKLFGQVKTRDFSGSENFSKKSWVAQGRTLILPRGSGQQIRGLNWIRFRPDLMVFDDLEDTETLENEEIRHKRRVWFFADALKAVPQTHNRWRVVYIDTVKHEDSLIEELLELDDWESLRLSICTDDYKTLAPSFKSQEDLDVELEWHREQHLMDVFAREYMSMPIAEEARAFAPELFRYYEETDDDFQERVQNGSIESIILIDPAKTAKMDAAESGFVVWGVDLEDNRMYFRYGDGFHLHPDQLYDKGIELAQQFGAYLIGVEVTGLKEYIEQPFRNEIFRRGLNYELIPLEARAGRGGELSGHQGGKRGRIRALTGFYRKGLIYHNKHNCGRYEVQLLGFPRSKRWDIMDASAYIVRILDMGLRYFQPKEYMPETAEEIENEYGLLRNDDALESDDWRIV